MTIKVLVYQHIYLKYVDSMLMSRPLINMPKIPTILRFWRFRTYKLILPKISFGLLHNDYIYLLKPKCHWKCWHVYQLIHLKYKKINITYTVMMEKLQVHDSFNIVYICDDMTRFPPNSSWSSLWYLIEFRDIFNSISMIHVNHVLHLSK